MYSIGKVLFFLFSRSKSFFFLPLLSLLGEIASLSFLPPYTTVGRQKFDARVVDFLCRQHNIELFRVRVMCAFDFERMKVKILF